MTEPRICDICEEGQVTSRPLPTLVEHHGVSSYVNLFVDVCDHCGSQMAGDALSVCNRRAVNRFRKRVDSVPLGTQIRQMRKAVGLTQAQAGALFGGGPVAFSKYESDDLIPDVAMSNLLRLAIHDHRIVGRLQELATMVHAIAIHPLTDANLDANSGSSSIWVYQEDDSYVDERDFSYSSLQISLPVQEAISQESQKEWKKVVH